jgi:hypothetical protein
VEKTVKRDKGQVDAWEIWNGPNFVIFWKGTPEDYYNLVKAASQKIREIDPQTPIIGGVFWRLNDKFVQDMFKAGAFENIDGISLHPYDANPKSVLQIYDRLISIANGYNYKGKIWITETGYPTGGLYPIQPGSDYFGNLSKAMLSKYVKKDELTSASENEDKYPAYIVKTVADFASRKVEKLMWYELLDHYNKGKVPSEALEDSENFFGLIYPDHTYKKAAYAFKLCSQNIPGKDFIADMPKRESVPDSVTALFFKGNKKNVLILWNEESSGVTASLSVANASPVLNDIESGKTSPVPAAFTITGDAPLFITWDGDGSPVLTKK